MSPAPRETLDEIKDKLTSTVNGRTLAELQEETIDLLKEVRDVLKEIKELLQNT